MRGSLGESYGLLGLKMNMLLGGTVLGGLLASSSSSFSDFTAASTSLVVPAQPHKPHDLSNTYPTLPSMSQSSIRCLDFVKQDRKQITQY